MQPVAAIGESVISRFVGEPPPTCRRPHQATGSETGPHSFVTVSGPSQGAPCRRAIRPTEASKAAVYYVRKYVDLRRSLERLLWVELTRRHTVSEWPLFAPSCPTRSTRRRDQVAAKRRLRKSVCGIQVAVLRWIRLARRSRRRCGAWHPLDKSRCWRTWSSSDGNPRFRDIRIRAPSARLGSLAVEGRL
jgi:hypothetical protein